MRHHDSSTGADHPRRTPFADQFDITIPLLSDPESRIITEFGILNTTIDESDAPFYGIPYPGSYVVGADGRVMAKFFEQNSLVRTHPETLLRATQGEVIDDAPVPSAEPVTHVEANVALSALSLRALLLTDLVVDLCVPPGQHLYGAPVPEGLVITSVVIDDNELVTAQPAHFPPTHEMTLDGTGETLHVYDGDVRIRIPLLYNGGRVAPNGDGTHTVDITGTMRWQSCDDQTCHIPRTEPFVLTVNVEAPNVPRMLRNPDPTAP